MPGLDPGCRVDRRIGRGLGRDGGLTRGDYHRRIGDPPSPVATSSPGLGSEGRLVGARVHCRRWLEDHLVKVFGQVVERHQWRVAARYWALAERRSHRIRVLGIGLRRLRLGLVVGVGFWAPHERLRRRGAGEGIDAADLAVERRFETRAARSGLLARHRCTPALPQP